MPISRSSGPSSTTELVADPHVAGIGREHAGDQAQEHGLARTRGAEHGDGLAALDGRATRRSSTSCLPNYLPT